MPVSVIVFPVTQAVHAVLPAVAAKVLAAQIVQSLSASCMSAAVAASLKNLPTPQLVQLLAPTTLYLPAAQIAQDVLPATEVVPEAHASHDDDPTLAEKRPATHAVHVVTPAAGEVVATATDILPAAQSEQTYPFAYLPAAHETAVQSPTLSWSAASVPVSAIVFPVTQAVQAVLPAVAA